MREYRLNIAQLAQYGPDRENDAIRIIERFARDPFADVPDLKDRTDFEAYLPGMTPRVRGAVAYYLFVHAATLWDNGSGPDADRQYCRALLRQKDLAEYVCSFYRIPSNLIRGKLDEDGRTFDLFKVGTTSVLLRCHPPGRDELLLKLIKPQYAHNPSIADATQMLNALHSDHRKWPFIPYIVRAGRRWVLMELVHGRTLREEMDIAREKKSRADYVAWVREVAMVLCDHLSVLHSGDEPEGHMDLSPDNIIVESLHRPPKLALVDRGKNYVLMDSVGSNAAVTRAQRYMAPEFRLERRSTSLAADYYSLGVVLLEAICPPPPSKLPEEHVDNQIHHVRNDCAPLALTLESMTDSNPDTRVFEQRQTAEPFISLKAKLEAELMSYERVFVAPDPVDRIAEWAQYLVPSVDRAIDRLREMKFSARLPRFAVWCQVVHLLMLAALADAVWFHAVARTPLATAWPGLAVAGSFAFIATKYYANIFADIDPKPLSRPTNFVMRLMSWLHGGPIIYTMLVAPTAWPFTAAFGVFAAALNNALAFRLAEKAGVEIRDSKLGIRVPPTHAAFLKDYATWAPLMAIYGTLLVSVGGLLRAGVLQDVEAYALMAVVLNAVIMGWNCTIHAPMVRNGLMWSYDNLRRARLYSPDRSAARRAPSVAPATT